MGFDFKRRVGRGNVMPDSPKRGDIWLINSEPVKGREQGKRRPALILSVDAVNEGPSNLSIVIPLTKTDLRVPAHVKIAPPEGNLKKTSYAMTEQIRAVCHKRLLFYIGAVSMDVIKEVEKCVRFLLGLK